MSSQPTYRSVVFNLVEAIEKQHGGPLPDDQLAALLGPLDGVYRDAKALAAEDTVPRLFVSYAQGGAYAASATDPGLSDVELVVVDQTGADKSGDLMSVTHADGTVFSAWVKTLVQSPVHFDTGKVLSGAKWNRYKQGEPYYSGMDSAIVSFMEWRDENRRANDSVLRAGVEAIQENGAETYEAFIADVMAEFKMALLSVAKDIEPDDDLKVSENRLETWVNEKFRWIESEMVISAAIYVRGIESVEEAFSVGQGTAPSM